MHVDFWNLFEADIERAAVLNVKLFRLSIEWSRIQPRKGEVDLSAVRRYHDIFDVLDRFAVRHSHAFCVRLSSVAGESPSRRLSNSPFSCLMFRNTSALQFVSCSQSSSRAGVMTDLLSLSRHDRLLQCKHAGDTVSAAPAHTAPNCHTGCQLHANQAPWQIVTRLIIPRTLNYS